MYVGEQPHVGAKHGVLAEPTSGFDLAARPDNGWAGDGGRRRNLGTLAEPHSVANAESGDLELHLLVEHIFVRIEIRIECADIFPKAFGYGAIQRQPFGEQLWKDLATEVDRATLGDVVEDRWLEHVDAGVDGVAEHLAPRGLLEEPFDGAVFAGDDNAEVEWVLNRRETDGGNRFVLIVKRHQRAKIHVGHDVARDHQEALVQQMPRVADAAGGT